MKRGNRPFSRQVSYPVIDRLQILSQLKSHLFHNIVKVTEGHMISHDCHVTSQFRGRFFGQKRGIPQGSCVSSLLCRCTKNSTHYVMVTKNSNTVSFYYDEMVEECLPKFDPKKEVNNST